MPHLLQLRKPSASEWPACRMLLPDIAAEAAARDYLLAIDPAEPYILGAISFLDNGVRLEHLRIHIIRGRQRTGIGTRLLQHVIAEAAHRGRSEITAHADAAADSACHSFFLKTGFRLKSKLFTAECEMAPALDYLNRMRNRAEASQRVAESVDIVPLSESLLSDAGKLYAEHIAQLPTPASARAYFSGDLSEYHLSQVLLVEGAVQGMVLISRDAETATVHARIVRERFRRGWASAVLLGRAIDAANHAGIQRLRFHFFDTTWDTLRLVERLKMPIAGCIDQFSFTLLEP